MSNPRELQFRPLESLPDLSDEQRQILTAQGIVSVELFVGLARCQPAKLAELLGCLETEVERLRVHAESLSAPELENLSAPCVPPFGLVPPAQRGEEDAVQESREHGPLEGDAPCDK